MSTNGTEPRPKNAQQWPTYGSRYDPATWKAATEER